MFQFVCVLVSVCLHVCTHTFKRMCEPMRGCMYPVDKCLHIEFDFELISQHVVLKCGSHSEGPQFSAAVATMN